MKKQEIRLLLELIDSILLVIKSADAFSESGEYDFRFQEDLESREVDFNSFKTTLTEKLEEED